MRRTCKRCGRVNPAGGMRFARRYFPHLPEWRCSDVRACNLEIELRGQTRLTVTR